MASAEGIQNAAVATEEYVNTVADKTAGAAVKRYFTIPGRDPFEELEWELRDAFIAGKDKPTFEQKGVEFPKFWSQTATNIVAQKYFRGRMSSPERERSVKQMIGRVVDTIAGWGRDGGYFATEEEAGTFVEATPDHVVKAVAERGTQPQWLRVDELNPGMRLHLHPHRAKVRESALVLAGGGSSEESSDFAIDGQNRVAAAEAALAGWLQADGFVGQYEEGTNRSLTIEFQVATDEEYDWVVENLDLALPHIHRHVRDVETEDESLSCRRIRHYGR